MALGLITEWEMRRSLLCKNPDVMPKPGVPGLEGEGHGRGCLLKLVIDDARVLEHRNSWFLLKGVGCVLV